MRYSPAQYARALSELAEEAPPAKLRETVKDFFDTVARNDALNLLPEIEKEFERLISAKDGRHSVTIISPEGLSDLSVALKVPFKASVKAIRDVRLLGGVVVEVNGLRVDNSVMMRLNRIREVFTK